VAGTTVWIRLVARKTCSSLVDGKRWDREVFEGRCSFRRGADGILIHGSFHPPSVNNITTGAGWVRWIGPPTITDNSSLTLMDQESSSKNLSPCTNPPPARRTANRIPRRGAPWSAWIHRHNKHQGRKALSLSAHSIPFEVEGFVFAVADRLCDCFSREHGAERKDRGSFANRRRAAESVIGSAGVQKSFDGH
jgi:hypothetical protein